MKVPFSPPDVQESDIRAVVDVLRSGWITSGPVGEKFSAELNLYCGSSGAVLVNSATAALEAVLRFLGVGEGDEVIVPAYTYTASASVIYHVGAKIVMVDVEPGSYFTSAERIAAAITVRTKAVILVDLAGVPVDVSSFYDAIADARSLFRPANQVQEEFSRIALIIDGAHSLGGERNGRRTGSFGDFTAFSFHAVKNLTTAEGGAITWNCQKSAAHTDIEKFFKLHVLHGQSKSALEKTNSASWEYDVLFPGYKANMPDVLAAIGYSQFQRYPEMIARRHEIIKCYDSALADLPVTPLAHAGLNWYSSGHLYMLHLNTLSLTERNEFIDRMYERGVSCNVHYKTLPMLTAYQRLGFRAADYPNAYDQYKHEVTLPLHTVLTNEQVEYVGATVRDILTEML